MLPFSYSNDFDDEPYLFRVGLGLNRASNYSSTLARQASVAYPGSASNNPASSDFVYNNKKTRNNITATEMNYVSDSGAWVTALAISAGFTEDLNGSLKVAYAYTDTKDKSNTENLDNRVKSDEFFLGYSRMLGHDFSIGIQGRIVNADIDQETLLAELGYSPAGIDTDLRSFDLKIGILYSKDKTWFYGSTIGIGYSDTTSEISNMRQLGSIPPGMRLFEINDNQNIFSFQSGLGYKPTENFGLFTDVSYYSIDSKTSGIVDTYQLSIGFDYNSSEKTTFMGGATIDRNNELTVSTGLQLFLTDTIPLDIAYQYNAIPEIKKEFGRFEALTFSVAIPF